jgi:hypothetical protein
MSKNVTHSAENTTNPTGNITNPAENTTNPTGNTTNPAGNTTNPAGNVTNPAGNVTNPVGNVTHPGKCPRCERTISKKHIKKHIEICKGVPKNTCGVCFRIFTTQSSHSRHQKNCKKKKDMNTNSEGPSSVIMNKEQIEQTDMLLERLQKGNDERLQVLQTELKKDYEQKIRLLQFRYDNDRAMMQELFN